MDEISAKLDLSEWQSSLNLLGAGGKESLARRMGAAGGRVFRDEAKQRAPLSEPPYNPQSRGSHQPGTLRDAIYLAYDERHSGGANFTYKISWNDAKAWWGKLVEFGYWRKYEVIRHPEGFFISGQLLPQTKWTRVPAKPFLRTSYDAKIGEVRIAMVNAGRAELPNILRELGI